MIYDELKKLLTPEKYQDAVKEIQSHKTVPITHTMPVHQYESILSMVKEYDAKQHKIFSTTVRPNKIVTDSDNNTTSENVARLCLPMQRKIVSLAASFLCGNPIKLDYSAKDDTEKEVAALIQKVWDDNKLDYKSKRIAKILFSETEVAELWYWPKAEEEFWAETALEGAAFSLRMKILANSLGDLLYPVFDPTGDMIAFGRGYRTAMNSDVAAGITYNSHFDIYTNDAIYKGTSIDNGNTWDVKPEANLIKKIPVIYYAQSAPDWYEVQPMIDRLEELISNHADTNDYFGDPTIIIEGTLDGFAKKGERGKMLEVSKEGKVSYLTWDAAPESIKLEIENLWKFIHTSTQTPDISFDNIKGLGTVSGFALKMLFLDAHMKASDKEEIVGEGVQRRINYVKHALGIIAQGASKKLPGKTVVIKPRFEYYLPKDDKEVINTLNSAVLGGIMSIETAVTQNPLIQDTETELELIKEAASQANQLNDLMNEPSGNGGGIVKPLNSKKQANG